MRVIGIDFGLTCGYAWTDSDQVAGELSGEWKLGGHKHEGGGMRFVRFEALLRDLLAPRGEPVPAAVFYEIAPPSSGARKRGQLGAMSARESYGGFLAVTTQLCERLEVPYAGVTVGELKRRATGKGNSPKPAVVAAARLVFGANLVDEEDNRADALWILQLGLDQLGLSQEV